MPTPENGQFNLLSENDDDATTHPLPNQFTIAREDGSVRVRDLTGAAQLESSFVNAKIDAARTAAKEKFNLTQTTAAGPATPSRRNTIFNLTAFRHASLAWQQRGMANMNPVTPPSELKTLLLNAHSLGFAHGNVSYDKPAQLASTLSDLRPNAVCLQETGWYASGLPNKRARDFAKMMGWDRSTVIQSPGPAPATAGNCILLDSNVGCRAHRRYTDKLQLGYLCAVELLGKRHRRLILISLYRPPHGSSTRRQISEKLLAKGHKESPDEFIIREIRGFLDDWCYSRPGTSIQILGDLNIDRKKQASAAERDFLQLFKDLKLQDSLHAQHQCADTRQAPGVSPSSIDYIWNSSRLQNGRIEINHATQLRTQLVDQSIRSLSDHAIVTWSGAINLALGIGQAADNLPTDPVWPSRGNSGKVVHDPIRVPPSKAQLFTTKLEELWSATTRDEDDMDSVATAVEEVTQKVASQLLRKRSGKKLWITKADKVKMNNAATVARILDLIHNFSTITPQDLTPADRTALMAIGVPIPDEDVRITPQWAKDCREKYWRPYMQEFSATKRRDRFAAISGWKQRLTALWAEGKLRATLDHLLDRSKNKTVFNAVRIEDGIETNRQEVRRLLRDDIFKWTEARLPPPDWTKATHEYLQMFARKLLSSGDHCKECWYRHVMDAITPEEIRRILEAWPKNKAPGVDGLTPECLLLFPQAMFNDWCHMISRIVQGKPVPQNWKTGRLLMLEKMLGVTELNKMRPITLLNLGHKVVAKIWFDRISAVWEEKSVLQPMQNGFRDSRSTMENLVPVVTFMEDALKNRKQMFLILQDISKAFDRVERWVGAAALWRLGLPKPLIESIMQLSIGNKKILTIGDGSFCDPVEVHCGSAQGGVDSAHIFKAVADIVHTRIDCIRNGVVIGAVGHLEVDPIPNAPVQPPTVMNVDEWKGHCTGLDNIELCGKETPNVVHTGRALTSSLFADDGLWPESTVDRMKQKVVYMITLWALLGLEINDKTVILALNAVGLTKIEVVIGGEIRVFHVKSGPEDAVRYLGLWLSPALNWSKQERVLGDKLEEIKMKLKQSRQTSMIRRAGLVISNTIIAAKVVYAGLLCNFSAKFIQKVDSFAESLTCKSIGMASTGIHAFARLPRKYSGGGWTPIGLKIAHRRLMMAMGQMAAGGLPAYSWFESARMLQSELAPPGQPFVKPDTITMETLRHSQNIWCPIIYLLREIKVGLRLPAIFVPERVQSDEQGRDARLHEFGLRVDDVRKEDGEGDYMHPSEVKKGDTRNGRKTEHFVAWAISTGLFVQQGEWFKHTPTEPKPTVGSFITSIEGGHQWYGRITALLQNQSDSTAEYETQWWIRVKPERFAETVGTDDFSVVGLFRPFREKSDPDGPRTTKLSDFFYQPPPPGGRSTHFVAAEDTVRSVAVLIPVNLAPDFIAIEMAELESHENWAKAELSKLSSAESPQAARKEQGQAEAEDETEFQIEEVVKVDWTSDADATALVSWVGYANRTRQKWSSIPQNLMSDFMWRAIPGWMNLWRPVQSKLADQRTDHTWRVTSDGSVQYPEDGPAAAGMAIVDRRGQNQVMQQFRVTQSGSAPVTGSYRTEMSAAIWLTRNAPDGTTVEHFWDNQSSVWKTVSCRKRSAQQWLRESDWDAMLLIRKILIQRQHQIRYKAGWFVAHSEDFDPYGIGSHPLAVACKEADAAAGEAAMATDVEASGIPEIDTDEWTKEILENAPSLIVDGKPYVQSTTKLVSDKIQDLMVQQWIAKYEEVQPWVKQWPIVDWNNSITALARAVGIPQRFAVMLMSNDLPFGNRSLAYNFPPRTRCPVCDGPSTWLHWSLYCEGAEDSRDRLRRMARSGPLVTHHTDEGVAKEYGSYKSFSWDTEVEWPDEFVNEAWFSVIGEGEEAIMVVPQWMESLGWSPDHIARSLLPDVRQFEGESGEPSSKTQRAAFKVMAKALSLELWRRWRDLVKINRPDLADKHSGEPQRGQGTSTRTQRRPRQTNDIAGQRTITQMFRRMTT